MAGYIATNLEDAGATIGIDARTLQRWIKDGCPGSKQSYSICEIVSWARENKWGSEDDMLIDAVAGNDDVKERLLKQRAEKLERENRLLDYKIEERESSLVDVAVVKAQLLPVAGSLREAISKLDRKFGPDAAEIVIESLKSFSSTLERGAFDCDGVGNES